MQFLYFFFFIIIRSRYILLWIIEMDILEESYDYSILYNNYSNTIIICQILTSTRYSTRSRSSKAVKNNCFGSTEYKTGLSYYFSHDEVDPLLHTSPCAEISIRDIDCTSKSSTRTYIFFPSRPRPKIERLSTSSIQL